MSTLTIRAIEDEYYFISFNPDGESWCSLRPNFQFSSSVYGKKQTGQNTEFLVPFDEKKKWNVGLFNPPLYVFTEPGVFSYRISPATTDTVITIPNGSSLSETELATRLTNSPNLVTTYNTATNVFTITASNNVTINISTQLASFLGLPTKIIATGVPPIIITGIAVSALDFYVPPETIDTVGIKTNKWYKGQYYMAIESCNIRVKNNYTEMEIGGTGESGVLKRPNVFQDTCIFAEVDIKTQGENGTLELQKFNPAVNVDFSGSYFSYTPFHEKKILFPIMMKRDMPPWNGTPMNLSLTGMPNARTTGFHTEQKSSAVHLVQLNANEEIQLSFRRSNGEKLPMATDYTYINPAAFVDASAYQTFLNSRDKGWFISDASVLLRISNARPEYL